MARSSIAPRLLSPTPRILAGDNPFGVLEEHDLLRPIRPSVPNYSETWYFAVCDRRQPGLGLFLHTGRVAEDLDLWWARTIAYLPGGEVLVERSFGRASDERGPATGNMSIRSVDPLRRWQLSFDGAGELTTREATSLGLAGAGPSTVMRLDVECEAVSPP